MKLVIVKISRERFIKSITDSKEDKFARTFVSKCDMMEAWDQCWGVYMDSEVCAAIVTTHSKRKPMTANLQLLHTFAKHRRKGYAKLLCEDSLFTAIVYGCKYYRVSAEPEAMPFYTSIGFKFIGKQKKCFLSMFPITSNKIQGNKPVMDSVTEKAVYSKRKGGCVEIFPEAFI